MPIPFCLFDSLLKESMPTTYDVVGFVNLPWNWVAMQSYRIVNGLFYYPKEDPEPLEDFQFSIITLPNLRQIPKNELSSVNRTTKNPVDQMAFLRMLKNPKAWYSYQINKIYKNMEEI